MDFEPVEGLEVAGYRLSPIDHLTPSSTSGDAYLLCPDGRSIDLYWKARQPYPAARWMPPTMPDGLGVITIEVTDDVRQDSDFRVVLDAAAALMEPILAAGIESPG